MLNYDASALALAALNSAEFGALTEADVAVVSRFTSDLDYYDSAATYDDRRFILGVDGDCYIIEGSTVFYLPVEGSAEGEFELASAEL